MRRTFVGTGWKMNFLRAEAEAYLDALAAALWTDPGPLPTVFVVPPFTLLGPVCERVRALGLPVRVGAQNMHWEPAGAFTGEISAPMLRDCGADLVELGHSERRAMFGETDAAVNRKVQAALAHGLTPLVCVGEAADERRLGVAEEVVLRQVKIALHGVPRERAGEVLVAYEPVWAIGAGATAADPAEVARVHGAIRAALRALHGEGAAERVAILYGGSVNTENARALLAAPDVDGIFVGRAAWRAEGLARLIRIAGEVRAGAAGVARPAVVA
jgi:triosephosphate isomerase